MTCFGCGVSNYKINTNFKMMNFTMLDMLAGGLAAYYVYTNNSFGLGGNFMQIGAAFGVGVGTAIASERIKEYIKSS